MKWTISTRFIASPEKDERLTDIIEYRFNDRFSWGIQYNPGTRAVNLFRVTWTLAPESSRRPLIVLSTSEARPGAVTGGHLNLTFGKSIPKSPLGIYGAVHYSTEDGFSFPLGASAQVSPRWSLIGAYDGKRPTLVANYVQKNYWITFGSAFMRYPLISVGFGF